MSCIGFSSCSSKNKWGSEGFRDVERYLSAHDIGLRLFLVCYKGERSEAFESSQSGCGSFTVVDNHVKWFLMVRRP